MYNHDAALKRYYRDIRRQLPSSQKLKSRILSQIEGNILAFLQDHPDADFPAIEAQFGTPEQIAAAYVDELGAPELLKKIKIRKRVLTIVISTVTIILFLWATVVIWAAISEHNYANGSVTQSGAIDDTP